MKLMYLDINCKWHIHLSHFYLESSHLICISIRLKRLTDSTQVSFLVVLCLIIKTIDYTIKVLKSVNGCFKHFIRFWFFINDHAVSTLIESSIDNFIKDHLTEFLKNSVHWESYTLCDVVNLNL